MKDVFLSHMRDLDKKKENLIKNFSEPEMNYFTLMEDMFVVLHKANLKALNGFISFAENSENESYFLKKEEIKE